MSDLPPRARDLNRKLGEVIGEFRRYYPDTTDGDVRRALEVAGEQLGGPTSRRTAVALVLAGLVAAGLGTIVTTGSLIPRNVPPIVWAGALALIAVAIFAFRKTRRDR